VLVSVPLAKSPPLRLLRRGVRDSAADSFSFFFTRSTLHGTEKERGYDSQKRTPRRPCPWLLI